MKDLTNLIKAQISKLDTHIKSLQIIAKDSVRYLDENSEMASQKFYLDKLQGFNEKLDDAILDFGIPVDVKEEIKEEKPPVKRTRLFKK